MFLDASAVVAVLAGEPDFEIYVEKLEAAVTKLISPLAKYEAVLAIARLCRPPSLEAASSSLDRFLALYDVRIIDITAEVGNEAVGAFAQFGKGRHEARLNMGDCFAYACAKLHGVPLLCKGNDFHLTGIEIA